MPSNELRSPQIQVLANGASVDGVLDIVVSNSNYLGADRYSLTASLSASGYTTWATDPIQLEILAGLDGAWQSLMLGVVDRLEFDLARQEVRVEGRDLTALFMAARTQESFENQTASDIATTLAGRQGLIAAVTPTTALVGRNFQNDHARTTLDQYGGVTTQWDLLIRLAEFASFDVWVSGQTLNFAPPDQAASPLVLAVEDCLSVELERVPALGSGFAVNVKSWDCRGQIAVTQTAGSGSPGYVVVRPNMTADAAQDLAERMLVQMSQQARCVRIEMPGDLTTMPRGTLRLMNTGTDFDDLFVITDVERRLSYRHGFLQTVQARIPPWTISSTS